MSGRIESYDWGDVDNIVLFFFDLYMEGVKRWVLRVDGVGNNGVNIEGIVCIDFYDFFKVFFFLMLVVN